MFTRPLIGGGFISALSVPLIAGLGLPIFTILAVVMTVGMTVWGLRRGATGDSRIDAATAAAGMLKRLLRVWTWTA